MVTRDKEVGKWGYEGSPKDQRIWSWSSIQGYSDAAVWEGNKLGKLNAQKDYQIFLNVLLLITMEVTAPDRQTAQREPQIQTYSVWCTILGNTTSLEDIRKPFGNLSAFPAHNSLWEYDYPRNMHAHALEILFSLTGLFRPPKIHLRTSVDSWASG